MIFHALMFIPIGMVIGAYSHKWLAKKTQAPANLTVANAYPAAKQAAKTIADDLKRL